MVDGDSNEEGLDTVTGTVVTLRRVSGGTQQSAGAFVQDLLTPTSRLTLTLSARVDRLAQLRRAQPRDDGRHRQADGEQRPVAPRTRPTRW